MFRGYTLVSTGMAWAACLLRLQAAEMVEADNFDHGNAAGSPPAGWVINDAGGTRDSVVIVDQSQVEPASAPFCVELSDESGADEKSNPFFTRRFSPVPTGRVSCQVSIPSLKQAPTSLEILSREGGKAVSLLRVTFDFTGRVAYSTQPAGGDAKVSDLTWKPGQWQRVTISWTDDRRAELILDDAKVSIQLEQDGAPSEFKIRTGAASISGQKAYIDDFLGERN